MKTGTAVALGVLGLAAVGVTVGLVMTRKPSGPPPPPTDADAARGYQVLPSCRLVVADETLAFKWAASLGEDPDLTIQQAIAKAIDNCSADSAALAAISSPEDIRILYFMLHALKSSAVTAGKYGENGKAMFNAEITKALAMIKMYGGGIDTSKWPGALP